MTFAEIRSRIEALCKLGGWTGVDPEPNYAFLANEGYRLFNRESQHNVEDVTITTTSGTAVYDLTTSSDTRGWIAIFDDATYGTTLELRQTTRDDLRRNDRLWRQRSAGQPEYWYWHKPNQIGLWPKPSATATIYMQGIRHSERMDSDTDVPDFDEEFHEGICLFGAWHQAKAVARGEESAVAQGYLAEAKALAARCKEGMAAQEASLVVRSVARPVQEYRGQGQYAPGFYWDS